MIIDRIHFCLSGFVKKGGCLEQLVACVTRTRLSSELFKRTLSSATSSANQQFDCAGETERSAMPRIFNVAEKNDAAKNIAHIMSNGAKRLRNSYSKYNKIYEFEKNIPRFGQSQMIFYSVSGHLLDKDFDESHRKWHSCDPVDLFEAPIMTFVPQNFKDIERSLQKEVRNCTVLIIWTDCDREGTLLKQSL